MNRRGILGLMGGALFAAGLASFSVTGAAFAAEVKAQDQIKNQVKGVVELFTSQGCSSCPPADRFAETLAQQDGVIVLGWHVDYWDYLGWKDTLGLKEATRRQKTYAMTMGTKRLITPQFIVNGQTNIDGARDNDVQSALSTTTAPFVAVSVRNDNGRVVIDLPENKINGAARDATVEIVFVAPSTDVKIERGENRGKTITYRNTVLGAQMLGMWDGSAKTIALPASVMKDYATGNCVIIVRDQTKGAKATEPANRIIGAAQL